MNSNARKEEEFHEFYELINSKKDAFSYIDNDYDKKTLDKMQQDYDEFFRNAYKETDEELIKKYRGENKSVTRRRLNIFRLLLVIFGVASIIVVLFFVAFGIKSVFLNMSEDKLITITSSPKYNPKSRFELKAEEGWKEDGNKYNKDASIIIVGPNNDKAFMVICEDKSEVGKTVSLEDYCSAVQELKDLDGTSNQRQSIITLKGYHAFEFKSDIINGDTTYRYLITVLETQDSFYQLVAWATVENYDNVEAEFVKMVNSFYQLD